MKIIKYTLLGLTNLPEYGPHPGTIPLILFTLMGGIAGTSRRNISPFYGFLIGAIIMLFCFGGFYLLGAYERGKDYILGKEKNKKNE